MFKMKTSAFLITLVLTSTTTYSLVAAAEPGLDQIQVGEGLYKTKNSSIAVSQSTEASIGHKPGIRAVATVNNSVGQLRVCSDIKINYQIIDMDKDWDNTEKREASDTQGLMLRTFDTINWYIKDENQWYLLDYAQLGFGDDKRKINIPESVTIIKNGITTSIDTEGKQLKFDIQPWTFRESYPQFSDEILTVDNLSKAGLLQPEMVPGTGQVAGEMISPIDLTMPATSIFGEIQFPVLTLPAGTSFISDSGITISAKTENEACLAELTPGKARVIYTDENDIELVAGENLKVQHLYKAQIEIRDLSGAYRPLTRKEIEDPNNQYEKLTWNLYQLKAGKSPEQCEFKQTSIKDNAECYEVESFAFNDSRVELIYDEQDNNLLVATKFKTQQTNNDAGEIMKKTAPNFSQQGAFVTVSFGYDDSLLINK